MRKLLLIPPIYELTSSLFLVKLFLKLMTYLTVAIFEQMLGRKEIYFYHYQKYIAPLEKSQKVNVNSKRMNRKNSLYAQKRMKMDRRC